MTSSNHITKVAIVGAGGNCGKYIAEALVKGGKHTVTAITRIDSKNTMPSGVVTKKVDYSKPETLVEALKGQECLIITMSVFANPDSEIQLINAAAEAGVEWVLPNAWGSDVQNQELVKDVVGFQGKDMITTAIKEKGMSWISVTTGFWYEWSLSFQAAYGFDIRKKDVIFFDEGTSKISTSTWPQVGRGVAGLLSIPIKPEGGDENKCLERFRSNYVYLNSFTISQMDMFESILRVTGDKKEDWKVTKVPSKERYVNGIKKMQEGNREGFAESMYTRVFYPDGSGNFEHRGLLNGLVGLPKEDLDEATKAGVERAKNWSFLEWQSQR